MGDWPNRRLLDLLKLEIPIIQAPMAGSDSVALARSVCSAGALGSLACALLNADAIRDAAHAIRQDMSRSFNLNFFCHKMDSRDSTADERWKAFLRPHYERLALDVNAVPKTRLRLPFDEEACEVVEEVLPEVVSFHFGLPASHLLDRLKRRRIKVLASATSVREAIWLENNGCDAIIAQGFEAGGHRAMFIETDVAMQVGLFALLPQVVDAVSVPVIAAGGIADARGIVAAFALGASGVQMGTAYLSCPEANVSVLYRQALNGAADTGTVVTNLFSGRPARGIVNHYIVEAGPVSSAVPSFPYAATLMGPLRTTSEKNGSLDYMQLWAGQAAHLGNTGNVMPANELTSKLATEALQLFGPDRAQSRVPD